MLKLQKIQIISSLLILCGVSLNAQDLTLDWVSTYGGSLNDTSYDMERDQNGDVIVTGAFKGTVDFDPSSNVFNMTSAGDFDIYVAKFNAFGEFIWAKRMGGSGFDRAHDVEIADNGDVLIAGYFRNTVDFNPGMGVQNLTSSGDFDAYVQRLDQNGNHIWVKPFHGSGFDRLNSMEIDDSGNIIVAGQYTGTIDLNPGGSQNLISSGGFGTVVGYNSFIVKLDSIGDFVWGRDLGSSTQNDICYGVAVDNDGNVYSSGFFKGTVDFDPGTAVYNLSTVVSSRAEVYIHKLNAEGDFVWVKNFPAMSGIAQGSLGLEMDIDPMGNVVTVGYFSGTVDFDPGANTHTLTSNGDKDGYISKLNANGEFISVYQIGGVGEDRVHDVDFDSDGNQYITGLFSSGSNVDFDASASGTYTLTALGNRDMFILKTDSNNNFTWAYQFGGNLTSPYSSDVGMSITHHNQSIYFTGTFNNTVDFDPTSSVYNLTSNGQGDGCVVKLTEGGCQPTSNILVENSCESTYESPSGNIYTSTGIYTDTLTNANGCDSILSIDLTLIEILNTTISNNGNSLSVTGNPVGTTYEWIDCENMAIVQTTSTNEYLLQPVNGISYAVIINNQGCIDTTDCYSYDKIGLEESVDNFVSLYPHPFTGQHISVLNKKHTNIDVVLRNNIGVVLKKQILEPYQNIIEVPYDNGIYYLDFIIEHKRFTKKIIKIE